MKYCNTKGHTTTVCPLLFLSMLSKMSKMFYYFLYIFFFPRSDGTYLLKYKEVDFILDTLDIMDRKTPPDPSGGVWCYSLIASNKFWIVVALIKYANAL